MPLQNKFSSDDPYVLTTQTRTANNNQASLNAAFAENDHIRGKSVAISSQNIIRTPANPFPQVTTVAANTLGAALGDVGQGQSASNQIPNNGGLPCFGGFTRITTPDGTMPIAQIRLRDMVMAFDADGKLIPKRVIGVFQHLVPSYTRITFADGHTTNLIEIHKYWQRGETFASIADIDSVWQWADGWKEVKITDRQRIEEETVVYNLTVEDLHCYIANGDAVSNLKPIDAVVDGTIVIAEA